MDRLILDTELSRKLHDLRQPLELCDESGRVLARAIPVVDLAQCEPVTPEVSEQELARRSVSGEKRQSTRDVLDQLEQL